MKKEINISKCLFLLLALFVFKNSNAQDEPQYTHYINNTMTYNPAYISTQEDLTFTALARSQWIGLEGAPRTYSASALFPSSIGSVGSGLNIIHDEIGPSSQTFFTANFSYEIKLSQSVYTSFGINGGGSMLNVNFNQGSSVDPNDPLLNNNKNEFNPVVGVGIMTYADNWYVGLSVPNFLKTDYYSLRTNNVIDEDLQYLLMGGYIFDVNANLKFKPAVLARVSKHLPFVIDYSANFLISDLVTAGLSYRSSEIMSALVGIQLSDSFYVGYSYDYTLSGLSNYNDGSHEIMLRFTIPRNAKIIQSPRFY